MLGFRLIIIYLIYQWEPEVIAIALMYLAAKLSKFEVKDWEARTPKHRSILLYFLTLLTSVIGCQAERFYGERS
jgi:hypothetical protein